MDRPRPAACTAAPRTTGSTWSREEIEAAFTDLSAEMLHILARLLGPEIAERTGADRVGGSLLYRARQVSGVAQG
jgi:hypothetical protein